MLCKGDVTYRQLRIQEVPLLEPLHLLEGIIGLMQNVPIIPWNSPFFLNPFSKISWYRSVKCYRLYEFRCHWRISHLIFFMQRIVYNYAFYIWLLYYVNCSIHLFLFFYFCKKNVCRLNTRKQRNNVSKE